MLHPEGPPPSAEGAAADARRALGVAQGNSVPSAGVLGAVIQGGLWAGAAAAYLDLLAPHASAADALGDEAPGDTDGGWLLALRGCRRQPDLLQRCMRFASGWYGHF